MTVIIECNTLTCEDCIHYKKVVVFMNGLKHGNNPINHEYNGLQAGFTCLMGVFDEVWTKKSSLFTMQEDNSVNRIRLRCDHFEDKTIY